MRPALVIAMMLAATACSDPDSSGSWGSESCAEGNIRYFAHGQGCAVAPASVVIDGDSSEWADTLTRPLDMCVDGCAAGDIVGMEVGREGTSALVVHLVTLGAPLTDPASSYVIYMYRADVDAEDNRQSELRLVLRPGGAIVLLDEYELTGYPITVRFTADGLEARIPTIALPFAGEMAAFTYTVVAGAFRGVSRASYLFCWYPAEPDTICSFI